MDVFKQHFAAYMTLVQLTKTLTELVKNGQNELAYTLKMFCEMKEKERDYIENVMPGYLANNNK